MGKRLTEWIKAAVDTAAAFSSGRAAQPKMGLPGRFPFEFRKAGAESKRSNQNFRSVD